MSCVTNVIWNLINRRFYGRGRKYGMIRPPAVRGPERWEVARGGEVALSLPNVVSSQAGAALAAAEIVI